MTPAEANYFITQARGDLASHQKRLRQSPEVAASQAAIDAILENLLEIAREHPAKTVKIDTLIERYRYR